MSADRDQNSYLHKSFNRLEEGKNEVRDPQLRTHRLTYSAGGKRLDVRRKLKIQGGDGHLARTLVSQRIVRYVFHLVDSRQKPTTARINNTGNHTCQTSCVDLQVGCGRDPSRFRTSCHMEGWKTAISPVLPSPIRRPTSRGSISLWL